MSQLLAWPSYFVMWERPCAELKAMRVVNDKKLLQGLKAGDRVEITLTRERAISIQRAK